MSLLVGCSDSGKVKIYNNEDVKLDVDITVFEVKDGFLISYTSRLGWETETLSEVLNKFKISALDVINFSLRTEYSRKTVILVKKTAELENKISEYLKNMKEAES